MSIYKIRKSIVDSYLIYLHRGMFMKLLLLKIKYFFAQKEVVLFFKVFGISSAVVALLSYYAYPYITWIFKFEDRKEIHNAIMDIINMPRSTNDNLIFDDTFLLDGDSVETTNNQFKTGDALHYRYTEFQFGKPPQ